VRLPWLTRRRRPEPTRLELLDWAYRALDDVWHNAAKDKRGLPDDFFAHINDVQSKLMDAWEEEAHRQQVSAQWAREDAEEDVRHER
jgi:uncharacterized membrane protein YccC